MQEKRIYANRALAILKAYLSETPAHISWLLPSTICFSVPCLFLSLGKKIAFYDFGYDLMATTGPFADKGEYKGILITDYYAKEIDAQQLAYIRSHFEMVIYDKCLSVPLIPYPGSLNYDLVLFSTGKGKIADIGFGGIGMGVTAELMSIQDQGTSSAAERQSAYDTIEAGWKASIEKGIQLDINLPGDSSNWISSSALSETDSYEKLLHEELEIARKEKETINQVYSSVIPSPLFFYPEANMWRFNILVNEARLLIGHIFEHGFFASRHYANAARVLGYSQNCHQSEWIENHIVNLFNYKYLSVDEAEQCAYLVKKLFHKKNISPVKPFT